MPPFSMDVYHELLQKIEALEMKILRLEVNVEVNEQNGNETTLPMLKISQQEQANKWLVSTSKKEEACKLTCSPPWNSLGAKPKHKSGKSLPSDMERRLTARTQHPEISDETGWPALPSRRSVTSTPVPRAKQPWTVATTRTNKSKPTQNTGIQLENRFSPLLEDSDSLKKSSYSHTRQRYEPTSHHKMLRKELTTGPQTLIVGDGAVNEIKHFCSKKNTKVLCFTNDMVSDISKKILNIVVEYPSVKSVVIHTGALDVVKQQSEVLKRDFMDLLNKVRRLNTQVFISGPLPTVRRGAERFSRLMMLNRWLKDTCAAQSINFINNFKIFWERRHLFKANGFYLNKAGVQLLSANIFSYVLLTPEIHAKDKRQNKEKQLIKRHSGEELLVPEISIDHGRRQTKIDAPPSSLPSSQQEKYPPAPKEHSQPSPPQTPTNPSFSPLSLASPPLDFTTPPPIRPGCPPPHPHLNKRHPPASVHRTPNPFYRPPEVGHSALPPHIIGLSPQSDV